MAVNWEEPQSGRGSDPGARRWALEAQQLKGQPGCWGVLETVPLPEGTAQRRRAKALLSYKGRNIRQGALAAFKPAGSFDATIRTVPAQHLIKLYVRYVGVTRREPGKLPVQVGDDGAVLPVPPPPPTPRTLALEKRRRTWERHREHARDDYPKVRAWALANGEDVSRTGLLPYAVIERYDAAMSASRDGQQGSARQ